MVILDCAKAAPDINARANSDDAIRRMIRAIMKQVLPWTRGLLSGRNW
jgi:hypothetical protein